MAVVSRMWYLSKETVKFFHGAWKVLINPSAPIPKGKLDPRMPAYPTELHEWFRVFPWGHYWAYFPLMRQFVYAYCFVWFVGSMVTTPHFNAMKYHLLNAGQHHAEADAFYAGPQRVEDVKYFKEHDVQAKLRPKYFARDLTVGDFKYYPLKFSAGH